MYHHFLRNDQATACIDNFYLPNELGKICSCMVLLRPSHSQETDAFYFLQIVNGAYSMYNILKSFK